MYRRDMWETQGRYRGKSRGDIGGNPEEIQVEKQGRYRDNYSGDIRGNTGK
jgi:hypothetical protein